MEKSNILFLSIDAFIANRCYGKNKTSKTPNIDSLIKNGVYFDKAFSSSDGTPVSFASLFTGSYPFRACSRKGRWHFKLQDDVVDYVTLLKKHGYHAYATIPEMWIIEEFFHLFENSDKIYPLFGYRLYDGLGQQIVDRLESQKMEEPWFYFVHIMDAHKPITFPQEFDNEEFGEDDYDKMISSIDAWIGKILQKVNMKTTIVVLTADHGDYLRIITHQGKRLSFEYKSYSKFALKISNLTPKFLYPLKNKLFLIIRDILTKRKIAKLNKKLTLYEKRCLFHARSFSERYLYDELFHIPLIFAGNGIERKNMVIEQQVRNVDIFPTLFDIIQITNDKEIHGRSLNPILQGNKLPDMPIYLESGFNLKNSSKAVMGIRTFKYKYFRSMYNSTKNIHLYNLESDQLEENNIASSQHEVVENMEKILSNIRDKSCDKHSEEPQEESDVDERVKEQLKKLGYI